MIQSDLDIIVITNSPGELSSWARVITDALKKKIPEARIVVFLVPCPYATGRELEIAEKFPSVDKVLSPGDFLRYFFVGKTPDDFKFASEGIVVFLGGDFWHAAGLAWRLKFPAVAYTARSNSGWNSHFKYIFCPDERIRKGLLRLGVPDSKIRVIGNLIVEGVRPHCNRDEGLSKWNMDPKRFTIGILPGSRLYHMQDSLPVFLKVAEEIVEEEPETQFLVGLSPFLSIEEVSESISTPRSPIAGVPGQVTNSGAGMKILTSGGVSIPILQSLQHDMMNMVDLVITIPGTNTAECAFLGRPMVVVSSWKARIPRGGLGFFMNALPIGNLRKKLYEKILRRLKFTALPNMIAQRKIVPEVFVDNEAREITSVVLDMIRDADMLRKMSEELKKVMGESGAADRMTGEIAKILKCAESRQP